MKNFTKKTVQHGVQRAEPLPSPDELKHYYESKYYQESDGKKSTYDNQYEPEEIEHKLLESRIALLGLEKFRNRPDAQTDKLIEFGCGEGFFLAEANRLKWSVKGVDFSRFAVEKWNPDLLENCVFGDLYNFLEQEIQQQNKYDACVLRNVVEHVIDPPALLKGIASILHEDSSLLITVPNDFSALQNLALGKKLIDKEFWFQPPDHLYYFNSKNIRPFLAECGYELIDMFSSFPVDFFLFHPASNYVMDKSKGKGAHFARIHLDLLMAQNGEDKLLEMYRAMAECGVGRDITVIVKKQI